MPNFGKLAEGFRSKVTEAAANLTKPETLTGLQVAAQQGLKAVTDAGQQVLSNETIKAGLTEIRAGLDQVDATINTKENHEKISAALKAAKTGAHDIALGVAKMTESEPPEEKK